MKAAILIGLVMALVSATQAEEFSFHCVRDSKGKGTVTITLYDETMTVDELLNEVGSLNDIELSKDVLEIALLAKFYKVQNCRDLTVSIGNKKPVKGKGTPSSASKKSRGYQCTARGTVRSRPRPPSFLRPFAPTMPRIVSISATSFDRSESKARSAARRACIRKGLAASARILGSYHAGAAACATTCKKK